MVANSLQPIDAQDNSNCTKSCAVRRFTSAFAGVCKQKHSAKKYFGILQKVI